MMVRSHYPYLLQQRRRWFVRMVVPADVRDIIGQSIFKVPTGHTDEHQAATVAAPIIADLQARIRSAREAGKRLEQVTAENLAERYRTERLTDPEKAEITRITDVIKFVLSTQGHAWADHAKQVRSAGYDVHAALRRLPGGEAAAEAADRITGHATPLLTYLERWKPDAGLKPRPLDQATSSIKQFDKAVGKPIEQIESKDVQRWIDGLINADGETGLNSKTVNRKLGEIRNYWSWLQSHQIVPDDRNPFAGRRVINPAKPEKREGGTSPTVSRGGRGSLLGRLRKNEVTRHWPPPSKSLHIPALGSKGSHSFRRLTFALIRTPAARFMRMNDKTAAGDRFVPLHPKIARPNRQAHQGRGRRWLSDLQCGQEQIR